MENNNSSVPPPPEAKSPPATAVTADENGGEAVVERELGDLGLESTVRRKRGRPRKYPVEENGVSPDFSASSVKIEPKRGRGRPPGTGKLQKLASLGGLALDTAVGNFVPHNMMIQRGEDVVQKLSLVANCGPRSLCILSAVGAVSIGHFHLLKLTGMYTFPETGGVQRKIGKLTVMLANPDGSVFGGAVAGSLVAAIPIQLIFASFNQNIKSQLLRRHAAESSTPTIAPGDTETKPHFKSTKVEENCIVTPPNRDRNTPSDQNVSLASLQSSDQNTSESLLDENNSNVNVFSLN
ncbi:AT-hook motif nuclear-localized protein [Actinidia chinensis var. chinensis]|uniref:AT-hook motif nuclear-localized protein n=1 Tax=Actinidia chinensis var. chinensis TaxID=1590841 RepID=A0A2R6PES0_ACTCC|nr:AT-hook motif nuclear-localized protein [Actinidia chinensis var. chinensis]